METTGKRSFVKGAAILGVAGLICKVIGALFRIPLYNMLGDGMKYYEAVYPWYSALIVISTSGLPTAISKMVAERVTLGDLPGAKRVFRKAQWLLLIIGVVTTALMYFFADQITALQKVGEGAALSYRALAPALLFVSLMCAYRGYLQGMQRMTGTAVSQLIEQAGKLGIGLYLAARFLPLGLEYAAMGALIGVTVSEFLALIAVALFYAARRGEYMPRSASAHPAESGIMQKLLYIAIPVTLGASIMPLTNIVDSTMIMRILLKLGMSMEDASMRYVALRTNVSAIVNMPAVLTMALAMSLVPAVSAARARGDGRGIQDVSRMGFKLALVIGLPCGIGLYVLGTQVVDFLYDISPDRLLIAGALMRTMAVGIIFLSLVQTLTGIIQGLGKPQIPVINLGIGAVVKVASMLILMHNPEIEIQGAAISTVLCYAVAGVLDAVYLIRKTRLAVNWLDTLVKPLIAAVVMGASVFFAYAFFSAKISSTSLGTLLSIATGGVIYFAIVVLSRMFTIEDLMFVPGGKRLARFMFRSR